MATAKRGDIRRIVNSAEASPRRTQLLGLTTEYVDNLIYNVYHIEVKYFDWDDDKNDWLIKNRGISFEMCQAAIESNMVLDVICNNHPYAHQKKLIIEINEYVYVVPFVEDETKIFFKTMYPSRKNTKKYLLK